MSRRHGNREGCAVGRRLTTARPTGAGEQQRPDLRATGRYCHDTPQFGAYLNQTRGRKYLNGMISLCRSRKTPRRLNGQRIASPATDLYLFCRSVAPLCGAFGAADEWPPHSRTQRCNGLAARVASPRPTRVDPVKVTILPLQMPDKSRLADWPFGSPP